MCVLGAEARANPRSGRRAGLTPKGASNHHDAEISPEAAMRTTLDIDEDLLRTAQELARRRGVSAGKVVSGLMREALLASARSPESSGKRGSAPRTGFEPLVEGQNIVTNDQVNDLREAEGI
jgi:hypothetical protein